MKLATNRILLLPYARLLKFIARYANNSEHQNTKKLFYRFLIEAVKDRGKEKIKLLIKLKNYFYIVH